MRKPRTRWTEAKVVEEILTLKEAGICPTTKYAVKNRPALYGAAQRLLGGWRGALIKAGLDPKEIASAGRRESAERRTKWTRAAIISALQERHRTGKGLDVTALRRDGKASLTKVARHLFGSYERAVEAAGFRYDAIRLIGPDWTSERVVEAIRELEACGNEINISAAQHFQSSLVAAAIRYFGSWDAALREVGFDPSGIRLDVNTESGKGRVFENLCDALFTAIRPEWRLNFRYDTEDGPLLPDAYDASINEWIDFKLAAWGMSVQTSIRKYSPYAGHLRFITLNGERTSEPTVSFQSVFEYEGEAASPAISGLFDTLRELKSDQVPGTKLAIWSRVWSREKLIEFIKNLPIGSLHSSYAQEHHRREYSAAVRQFGGWAEALEAAGFSPAEIKRRRDPYTKQDVDEFIRGRITREERLDAHDVMSTPSGSGLYQAASRFYGEWSSALRANGVNPDEANGYARSRRDTLDRLHQFIQARHAAGARLNAQFIRDNYKAEYRNALRLAGSWRAAVEKAGVDYRSVSLTDTRQLLTKADVDSYIFARHRDGLALSTTAVRRDNRAIHTAALRKFYGSWKAALEANGVVYPSPRNRNP